MNDVTFLKMHGAGNDFVILDGRGRDLSLSANAVRAVADRRRGVGCDQVIRMEPSERADLFMRIWNPDGNEAEACGNATRCVARLVMDETGTPRTDVETLAGVLPCMRDAAGTIRVDMGEPQFGWRDIPLAGPAATDALDLGPEAPAPAFCVSMGNPHAVLFVDDCDAVELAGTGPALEHHPVFPRRANVSFCTVESRRRVRARVWERGAGATPACGSAACAIAVAGNRRGLTDREVQVALPGGELELLCREDDHVLMAGPTAHVCSGVLSPELVAE